MLWTKGIKLRTETSPQERASNIRELASQALRLPFVLVLGEMPVRNFIPEKPKNCHGLGTLSPQLYFA